MDLCQASAIGGRIPKKDLEISSKGYAAAYNDSSIMSSFGRLDNWFLLTRKLGIFGLRIGQVLNHRGRYLIVIGSVITQNYWDIEVKTRTRISSIGVV